jgi:hypothetical protein
MMAVLTVVLFEEVKHDVRHWAIHIVPRIGDPALFEVQQDEAEENVHIVERRGNIEVTRQLSGLCRRVVVTDALSDVQKAYESLRVNPIGYDANDWNCWEDCAAWVIEGIKRLAACAKLIPQLDFEKALDQLNGYGDVETDLSQ